MGLQIFESSGTFSPSAHGLAAGDTVDLILVAGGYSGEHKDRDGNLSASVAGGVSRFGSLASTASGAVMGKGGLAYEGTGESYTGRCGSGAGGYLPGLPVYGGNGAGNGNLSPVGLAGAYGESPSPYANPYGDGNKGATGFDGLAGAMPSSGGNGYGAGASGTAENYHYLSGGGNAGKIAFASVRLLSTADIAVTVGSGGTNAGNSASRGAPGVVLVFW